MGTKKNQRSTQKVIHQINKRISVSNAKSQYPPANTDNTNTPTENTNPQPNDPRKGFWKQWKNERPAERVMNVLTVVIAIPTLLIANFTCEQISMYWDAVKVENRAYLIIDNITVPIIDTVKKITIPYQVINTGKTPAQKFFPLSYIILCDSKRNGKIIDSVAKILEDIMSRRDSIGFIVGNTAPVKKSADFDSVLTINEVYGIFKGTKSLFLLVMIKYFDGFGDKHYTWTCIEFDYYGSYRAYPKYNWAN